MEIKTPELDKMKAVSEDSQKIGAFLDAMKEQGMVLCTFKENDVDGWDGDDGYWPIHMSIEQTLAKYFNIDLTKCDEERQAILDSLRNK